MVHQITQKLLDVMGEPVETVVSFPEVEGIWFVQVGGGFWRIYNPELNQALKRRFETSGAAFIWAKSKILEAK